MKVIRILAIAAFAFFAFLAPTAAHAAPGDPSYGGVQGGVTTTTPTQSGNCVTTQVTVSSPTQGTVKLTVKNSSGSVVSVQSASTGTDGKATFTVRVCGSGTFTATGTGPDGGVLGTSQFQGAGSQGGGSSNGSGTAPSSTSSNGGSNAGGLPSTGAPNDTLLIGGAAALLLVGGITVRAARRKAL